MDSYERLIKNLKEITVDLIPINNHNEIKFSLNEQDINDTIKEMRFDDRFRPLIKEEEELLKHVRYNEVVWMKSKLKTIFELFLKNNNFTLVFRI
jgi:hypothetical protein